MLKDRNTAIFYTAAICNLNCRYCSIDKNPVLVSIDKELENSFKGDYYINFLKEIFPDPEQLERVETWGGEPSLGWHRMHNLLNQIINFYPKFSTFFSSTNMVQPTFLKELEDLLDIFGNYPDRKFRFILQLSLDGPDEINDKNRGKNVTNKIREVFLKMCDNFINIIPQNVFVETYFKPTLDNECIEKLQTKESIINYYNFFEEFYDVFYKINKSNNVKIFPTIPNTATPGRNTVEDGKNFSNMCKICKEIEKDNPFKYFEKITPYNNNSCRQVTNIDRPGFTCGTCKFTIGLLPNDMISGCHAAFVDLLEEYQKSIKKEHYNSKSLDYGIFNKDSINFFCFHKSELAKREKQIEYYYKENTTARLITLKTLIQTLAYAGQIDEIFIDEEKALQAADLYSINASNCMKDNIGASSSITIPSASLIKLLLNGAYEYISQ